MRSIKYYIKHYKNYIHKPSDILYYIVFIFRRCFSDTIYLKIIFRLNMGYCLNLKNPKTFSEKLQWLKLYDHNPLYTTMVDKYKVKDYVRNILGDDYVIPLLGVWDKVEDIDWNSLPNQFVIKTNHDSQGVIICKDKAQLDIKLAKKKIAESLKRNYFYNGREWPYKNVEKKVFAEKFVEDEYGELRDYKFFCFNGIPKYCQVVTDRQGDKCIDFFDRQWIHQSIQRKNHSFSSVILERPNNYEKMWELASVLSHNVPFLRVDFYNIKGRIYFGEMTFFPAGGVEEFVPSKWDGLLGDFIKLPTDK